MTSRRIATGCLTHLTRRTPRLLPPHLAPAADSEAELPPVAVELPWLDPYPDRLVDPHEAAVARETLEIAFVAAIKHLRPRHRAALILRDVAGCSARDTAGLLAPVNLQRAFAVYLRAPGERSYRPLALAVLHVEEGSVIEVVQWDRPELFEAFGLSMSFPLSDGSNQDEVNAKEVR